MEKIVGILGGMGPLATADFFRKIVLLTDAANDQEHLRIIIDNNTSIPDRTECIINNSENPLPHLIESARKLESAGASFLTMPCNTAHYFYDGIIKNINIPFLNMITETAVEIIAEHPGIQKIGLLATEGTCKSRIYEEYFKRYHIDIITPDDKHQQYITDLIYAIKEGNDKINLDNIHSAIDYVKNCGAEVLVLGCTELPVAFEKFKIDKAVIDPTTILAKSAIKLANKKIKQNYSVGIV